MRPGDRNWLAFNIITRRANVVSFFWCPTFKQWFPRCDFDARLHVHDGEACNCLIAREGAPLAHWNHMAAGNRLWRKPMDPDANLAEQRQIIARLKHTDTWADREADLVRLVDLVEALDQWLTQGARTARVRTARTSPTVKNCSPEAGGLPGQKGMAMTPQQRRVIESMDLVRCPNSGTIVPSAKHDDKVYCDCGQTHVKQFCVMASVDAYVTQEDAK